MKSTLFKAPRLAAVAVALSFASCAGAPPTPRAVPSAKTARPALPPIPKVKDHGRIVSAGQPSKEHLEPLFKSGVRTIINLRTPGETKYDEASEAKKLGFNYVAIPVAGAQGLTTSNVDALHRALQAASGGRVLLHCGSSNRVGALMALRAQRHLGKSDVEALDIGRAYGLTRLETAVRARLEGSAEMP